MQNQNLLILKQNKWAIVPEIMTLKSEADVGIWNICLESGSKYKITYKIFLILKQILDNFFLWIEIIFEKLYLNTEHI